jgi:hypothetical protein
MANNERSCSVKAFFERAQDLWGRESNSEMPVPGNPRACKVRVKGGELHKIVDDDRRRSFDIVLIDDDCDEIAVISLSPDRKVYEEFTAAVDKFLADNDV